MPLLHQVPYKVPKNLMFYNKLRYFIIFLIKIKNTHKYWLYSVFSNNHYGAEKRNRTPNLLITIQLLYQLSYFSMVALIGFEPMHAGVRVQSLTAWPQGNYNINYNKIKTLFKEFIIYLVEMRSSELLSKIHSNRTSTSLVGF